MGVIFNKKGSSWFLLIGWSCIIWLLATRQTIPTSNSSWLDFLWRQGGHIFLHMILFILAFLAGTTTWKPFIGFGFALIFSSLHTVLDEVIQIYIPGRSANIEDILTNFIGIFIGILITKMWRYKIN